MIFKREDPRVGAADIVTNLNYVRPLDKAMLARLKPTAVIPLMFETWEYRPSDLDLEEARRLGICVLGTNERDERLRVLEYIGPVAVKLAMEMGVEVLTSRVVVLGGGHFGNAAAHSLRQLAEVLHIQPRGPVPRRAGKPGIPGYGGLARAGRARGPIDAPWPRRATRDR